MKKKIFRIILIIFLIIVIAFFIKFVYNFRIINKIGKKIVDTYSLNNVYYEYKNIGKNTESSIRKRLNKKIYYELIIGENEGITKQTYYSDNENDICYYIPNDEKVLITDQKAVVLHSSMDTRMPKTRAEVYCYQVYLGNMLYANSAYDFRNIRNKKIDNKDCYEITMKFDSYLEKTYFDKETLLPIKTIKENTKNNNILEWNIIIKENVVTEEEVIAPEEYPKMTLSEYYEYIRQKDIDS